ncbi:MAG: hypothetical protein AAF602_28350, partial [Myxococcota bacterium]
MSSPADIFFLSLSLPPTIGSGEIPILSLRLEHRGDERLYLPVRFAVAPLGDVRLEVACDGRVVPFASRVRLGPLRASDYTTIEPGEVVVAGIPLSPGYDVAPAGLYTVSAQLRLGAPPDALSAYRVAEGEVGSETVRMRVRPGGEQHLERQPRSQHR